VTISSAVNLLLVGVILVVFVIVAPNGVIGIVHTYWQRKPDDFVGRRRVETDAPGSVP
jgi:branched-chain amino acid transport system permease protein